MLKSFAKRKGLSPTVFRLGLISLFADISSEMLYPITPIFLTSVLGASMVSVGFIEGLAEALASILKVFAGRWSDLLGKRKFFVWIGYLLAAIAKPAIGLSQATSHVLIARAFDRTGKGLRSAPRDALLAESVRKEERGAAFGWHRFMDTLGAVIGPLLALCFLSFYSTNLRSIYLWATIPGVLAVLVALTISDIKKTGAREEQPVLRLRSLPKSFKTYIVGWIIFSLANSSDVFLLLRAKQLGSDNTTVILLYCLYNLTYAVFSPYLGGLSDVVGRKKCLVLGLAIFSIVYLGFAVANSMIHLILLFAIYGIYMAATDGVGKAFAVDLLPENQKATAVGILGTTTEIATVISSTLAGFLWERFSPQMTFLTGSAGSVLAISIFLTFLNEGDSHAPVA